MSLTRRDIAETSIRTITAFLTAVAIVGAGIGFFVSMAGDLKAQQKEVLSIRTNFQTMRSAVDTLQKDVATLTAGQKVLLEWVRAQPKATAKPQDPKPK